MLPSLRGNYFGYLAPPQRGRERRVDSGAKRKKKKRGRRCFLSPSPPKRRKKTATRKLLIQRTNGRSFFAPTKKTSLRGRKLPCSLSSAQPSYKKRRKGKKKKMLRLHVGFLLGALSLLETTQLCESHRQTDRKDL